MLIHYVLKSNLKSIPLSPNHVYSNSIFGWILQLTMVWKSLCVRPMLSTLLLYRHYMVQNTKAKSDTAAHLQYKSMAVSGRSCRCQRSRRTCAGSYVGGGTARLTTCSLWPPPPLCLLPTPM